MAHDSAKCRAQAVGFSDTLEHFFSDHFRNAEWFFFFESSVVFQNWTDFCLIFKILHKELGEAY